MAKSASNKTEKKLKAKARKLKTKVKALKDELRERVGAAVEVAAAATKIGKANPVSPLAPKGGFPKLPVIEGVRFAAAAAGVKYAARTDVMLAHLAPGSSVAGVFTRSSTRAACVLDCQDKLAKGSDASAGAAIIVNSGNANAFTGALGQEAVDSLTEAVGRVLDVPQARVLSSSTGVIGEPLPVDRITARLDDLAGALDSASIELAARAIMTTDTFPKGAGAEIETAGGKIRIAGIAKGSGMIAPDMATMLAYIFTDAKISADKLQKMVSRQAGTSFNAITVDSDTSTSDAVIVAATGTSGADEVGDLRTAAAREFEAALGDVMRDLAQQVVRDGEGASKFVEIRVSGASDAANANKIAMAIANSPLVKTAIAGEDANWGRIVMAIGKSGGKADRDRISIRFGDILVAENGWRSPDYSEEATSAYMKRDDLAIHVDLGLGKAARTVWTCDLTHGYIDINADYRS